MKVHLYPIDIPLATSYLGFMQNIKFSYLYRDGGNNKNYGFLIFSNPDDIDLLEFENIIKSKLIDGIWFYVNEWKLPDLNFKQWDDEIDHIWHEFERVLSELISIIKGTDWYFKFLINHHGNKDVIGKTFGQYKELTTAAKNFADELTVCKIIENGLNNYTKITQEYFDNHETVRDILLQRGVSH